MNFDKMRFNKIQFLIVLLFSYALLNNVRAIQIQEKDNWCWAASVQDVLAQVGVDKTKTEITARLLGAPIDRPAYAYQVVGLLNSYGLIAWEVQAPASPEQLQSTLNSGWRIIALARPTTGLVGHFIVLEAADSDGQVAISDPATGQTRTWAVNALYEQWHWIESVVVGRPRPTRNYVDYSNASSRLDTQNDSDDMDKLPSTQTTPFSYKKPDWMTDDD